MLISHLQDAEYSKAYGIFCAKAAGANSYEALTPTFCRIPIGGATEPHQHFEPEIFFIVSGEGRMQIEDDSRRVAAGDLIRIPANSQHVLINEGQSELQFLSVYSDDIEVAHVSPKTTITAAPPTPNGPLHLGHISGPYLAADIVGRFLRQQGSAVLLHSGTDDNQNYVTEKALSLRQSVTSFRHAMRGRIENGLRNMGINFDEFIEPKADFNYQQRIQNFAKRAISAGVIEKQTLDFPYCGHCEMYLVDAVNSGYCPSCEESSNGACESCGIVVPPQDLLHTICGRCHNPSDRRPANVHLFNLSRYLPLIEKDLENLSLPPRLRHLVRQVQRQRQVKVLVNHPHSAGDGISLPGTNLSFHVWFEMAAHYERFALDSAKWIHCFGFDNAFYYLLFIPALLRSLNENSKLPNAVLTNEFLNLEGKKFSTSRNHAIWADEFKGNSDHLRLFLSLHRPAMQTADFRKSEFEAFSAEFGKRWETLIRRAKEISQLLPPDSPSAPTERACHRLTKEVHGFFSPETLDLRRASRRILEHLDATEQAHGDVANEEPMLRILGELMKPIMPKESERLLQALLRRTSELPSSHADQAVGL